MIMGASGKPTRASCLEVSRTDLGMTRLVTADLGAPADGEVLFEVERFGLSANNVTYAQLGRSLGYWDLFPAAPGWGRIPVWGRLRACSSAVPGIEPGRRAFGPCPMATHVILCPGRVGAATFTEGSAHRAGLSSVYNVYSWADAGQPGCGTAGDDALVILRPVFWLSFTLDDYLADRILPGRSVVVTSASSKAALGLAHLLARRGVPVTGLTSARHAGFARSVSLYDQVLSYDDLGALSVREAVLIDIAGDAGLRDRVRRHLAGQLAQVVLAGGTHRAVGGLAAEPTGERSVRFFAPDRIRELAREQGWPALEQRFGAALGQFAADASWLAIVRHHGLGSVASLYEEVLDNATSPAEAHIISLTQEQ